MKAFLCLCFVLFICSLEAHNVHLSQSQKDKASEYTAECIKESGVKPEVLAEAKKGHIHDDEALKKFIFCFFQKSGIISSDAKLNTEVALSKLPQGIDKAAASKLLDECKSKTGKDHADTAFQIFKCYYQGTKQHILL
ncbi:general odorant-binding protein 56d-like [Epargyreus clarus]|uniref:general odorant-binding protein 56d-like n=1 Tax=Epargyreus clarus TaxID=520877 RepID=UPI003C2F93D8